MARRGAYTYPYPRLMVTVDAVVFAGDGADPSIALVARRNDPYGGSWALPGGFIELDERLIDAAARELREETGLAGVALEFVGVFDDPDRDPRGRSISVAYAGRIAGAPPALRAADDAAAAEWHRASALPPLAFDHAAIVAQALARLRSTCA